LSLQKATGSYDNKVDIYALGLVLVEILIPCKTESEKSLLFQDMRNIQVTLPDKFMMDFPDQVMCNNVRFTTE